MRLLQKLQPGTTLIQRDSEHSMSAGLRQGWHIRQKLDASLSSVQASERVQATRHITLAHGGL